jgi:hypothetical protein
MICRMNRQQREALIELIEAIIDDKAPESGLEESVRRLKLEDDFHKCFENENQDEDNHNHVSRT